MEPLSSMISLALTATLRVTRVLTAFADSFFAPPPATPSGALLPPGAAFDTQLDDLHRLHAKLALLERLFVAAGPNGLSNGAGALLAAEKAVKSQRAALHRSYVTSAALYDRLFEPAAGGPGGGGGGGADNDVQRVNAFVEARDRRQMTAVLRDMRSVARLADKLLPILGAPVDDDEGPMRKTFRPRGNGSTDEHTRKERLGNPLRGPHSHFAAYLLARKG